MSLKVMCYDARKIKVPITSQIFKKIAIMIRKSGEQMVYEIFSWFIKIVKGLLSDTHVSIDCMYAKLCLDRSNLLGIIDLKLADKLKGLSSIPIQQFELKVRGFKSKTNYLLTSR